MVETAEPTPEATDAPPAITAATPPLTFDVAARMRVTCCQVCGVQFGLPAMLYLHRANEGGAIHCPSGHVNTLRPEDERPGTLLLLHTAALAEVMQLRHELQRATIRLAALEPLAQSPAMDDAEVQRRCRVLVARSEPAGDGHPMFGKKLCRWCGKPKAPNVLRRHYLRDHQEDVRMLPASEFV